MSAIGQGGAMTRRTALAGLGAAVALPLLARSAGAQAVYCPNACRSMIGAEDGWIAGLPVIDAHCHILNARDIPAVRFITQVFLPNYAIHLNPRQRQQLNRDITGNLGGFLSRTPGYAQEKAVLEARLAGAGPEDADAAPPGLPRFARGGDKSCFGRDVADNIAAMRNLITILTGFRYRIFETLAATYDTGLPEIGVSMFTPAMVDMEYWLGPVRTRAGAVGDTGADAGDLPQATIAEQVELMELIQRLYPGRVHGFVAFCPWRQVDDEHFNRAASPGQRRPTALEVVEDAILNRGHVGVKLYPPMGFRAFANAEIPLNHFPAWAAAEPYASRFGHALDEALLALYRFCARHDVPVMAHTAPSNGAGFWTDAAGKRVSYGARAHPDYWGLALAQRGLEGLRVNLAHFGDIPWRGSIGALMDAYDHVYSDLSHYSDALLDNFTGTGQHCREATEILDPIRREFLAGPAGRKRARRLIYGSDWSMMSKEFYYGDYLLVLAHMYRRKIHGVGQGAEKNARAFMCGNAIRFLGLHRAAKTRARLEAWYAKHGLDASPLSRFDNVEA